MSICKNDMDYFFLKKQLFSVVYLLCISSFGNPALPVVSHEEVKFSTNVKWREICIDPRRQVAT